MRNLFTRFLMIVFLFSVFYQAYAAGAPPAPPVTSVDMLWPEDESTTQAQPGTNVLVLELSKDLNTIQPFGPDGVFGLIWESQSLGYQQKESILYKIDGALKITKVGPRTVEIRFAEPLLEDETYHVTIEDDAIRFEDGSYFGGIAYTNPGNLSDPNPEWRFTVDDVHAPLMTNCGDVNNVNGKFNVSIDQNPISFCFNEPVWWADGVDPWNFDIGDVAFYTAAKAGLDPNTEFGGDVIYEEPLYVILYNNGVEVYNTLTLKSAAVAALPPSFDRVEIYLKDEYVGEPSAKLKHAAIGNHVWPVDRDIYLRFAAGLLEDKAGNPFGGVNGSPYDIYSVGGDQYWFSTRLNGEIPRSARAVKETSTIGAAVNTAAPLWDNDDIIVRIDSDNLAFIAGNAAITTGNAKNFIKLSVDGVLLPSYTVTQISAGSGITEYLLEPGTLQHKKPLKVEVLGGLVHDKGDLREVLYKTWSFNAGDFLPPVITTSVNNILCTNFDIRVNTDENGIVYYAIVKDTLPELLVPGYYWPAFPTDIIPAEVVKGQVKRDAIVGGVKYSFYWHFYHVEDAGATYGKAGKNTAIPWTWTGSTWVAPTAPAPVVHATWVKDEFNVTPALTAFEHVDDFTLPNHGDKYKVFLFALDPNAQGVYNNPTGTPVGRVTTVTSPLPTPVQLTDCVEPDLTWFYEDIDDDVQYDQCSDSWNPRILKDGMFKLDFLSHPEGYQLVDGNLDWVDVLTLEVREYNGGSWTNANPWMEVEIASAVKVGNALIVTPLNNYPSQGRVRITLASGSIEDAAGNAINSELVCRKNVEIYDDPWVHVFTVENSPLMFPAENPLLNGVAANKDGKITIIFNNPMYSPERDSPAPQASSLLPISLDPLAENYVGNYVKLREGDDTNAEVTDDVATHIPLSFQLYDEDGDLIVAPNTTGVVKIVATPTVNYNSETWYYVELEKDLRDENLRELSYINALGTWDNNLFVDIHEQYAPYPAVPFGNPPYVAMGNSANYFMRFKSEDTISPELRFVFEKIVDNYPVTPNPSDRIFPYIEEVDGATVTCIDPEGHMQDGIPVGAIITEWSTMGFDNKDYYINEDPNGLRPYFKMKNAAGAELPFDVVVLHIYTPDAVAVPGLEQYTRDAVWFGFIPFVALAEGQQYKMEFNPNYQAPQSGQEGIDPGPVFVDDNGNPLVKNTNVIFNTCSEQPACFTAVPSTVTTVVAGKNVAASETPDFTITLGESDIQTTGTPAIKLTGDGFTWYATNTLLYVYNGNTVKIPWEAFTGGPATLNKIGKEYTIIAQANAFVDQTDEDLKNCVSAAVKFWSPDSIVPVAIAYSPDIDNFALSVDVGNAANADPKAIDPRNPGLLTIKWNESVLPQAGKVIEIWENGTTERKSFTYPGTGITWIPASNTITVQLPADFFRYYQLSPKQGHFHVDVEAGFVKDLAGNASDELTGNTDRIVIAGGNGSATWTFQTGTNVGPTIPSWKPICLLEPGNMDTHPVSPTEVQIDKFTLVFSEGVTPVAGKKMYVRLAAGGADLFVANANTMTASGDKKTYTIVPATALIVPNYEEYRIYVEEGAFIESYKPENALALGTPNYENENYLNCLYSGFTQVIPASFAFADITAPWATIWPVNGNVKVPFNAHGYVTFNESLIARAGFTEGDPKLVLTQSNIKNWIKVKKSTTYNGSTYVDLLPSEYVVEFVDLGRTHMRITFLDEAAPAINGVTANMVDEWNYEIDVNTMAVIGGVNYYLQDYQGNFLGMPTGSSSPGWIASANVEQEVSKFTTEDITVPNFYATTCDVTDKTIKVNFTPWENVNPYAPQVRTYPKESGVVYYVVKPAAAQAPTAANLYDPLWRAANLAKTVTVPAGGASDVWTMSTTVDLTSDYDFKVYAVMQDDETDVFASYSNPAFGNAWPTTDAIFIGSGDTNPASGAIGLADIRPAPNKNMTPRVWNFCFCDNDAPIVKTKQHNTETNVLVDATFEITFDELIQAGEDVILSGIGTGGTILTPEYGYEVRLREWNNNVAVPISLRGNGTGTYGEVGAKGFIITPEVDLLEETRYYIEIDRWVVWDKPGSNCAGTANIALPTYDAQQNPFPTYQCSACSTNPYQNNFPGWIGRDMWWFQTTDNTPPVLTSVAPLGNCVPVNNNKVVFTFEEKNGMIIDNLAGQSNNIYIYKVGSVVPYEIISAHSTIPVRVSGSTWTITYTTMHPYNSEEEYYVLWDKNLFKDNANPIKHKYTEALAEVIDYAPNNAWHQFTFETEDALLPVVDWSFVNRMWVAPYGPQYVYSLADGSLNSNDILSEPVDVCEMYAEQGGVPQQVGMYVWFNEEVELTDVDASPSETYMRRWINANFKLSTTAGSVVTLDYISHGIAGGGGMAIPGGVTIPAGKQWFYMKPLSDLASLGTYDFAVVGDAVSDMIDEGEDEDCRTNTLDETELFNFCVWDARPPVAMLYDGLEDVIIDDDVCVAEREYIRLEFNKPVVKTVNVEVPPQFGTPDPFSPWWTYSNLYLTENDLKDTDGDPIFTFKNITTGFDVKIKDVDISPDHTSYTLWLDVPMASENLYRYSIEENTLKDMVRIPNGNFFPGQTWDFTITDWIAPYITSLTPPDELTQVSPVAALQIVFNEKVVLGTSARIIIRDNGNPQGVIYNFPASDNVHVLLNPTDERTVTIAHEGLKPFTTYYVQIEPGFVHEKNCGNLPFGGKFEQGLIDDTWNFTTGDVDGPVASLWPTPGDGCVEVDANLVIRFDENINLTNDGRVAIYKVREGDSFHNPGWPSAMFGDIVAVYPLTSANDPQVRLSGSNVANGLTRDIITITPESGLWESNATYYVRIVGNGTSEATEADVVVDASGNSWKYPVSHPSLDLLPGIHQNQWYFTIGNTDEPELVSVTPERGDIVPVGVASAMTDVTMTFSDEIAFGEGAIQIWEFIEDPEGGVANQEANPWRVYNVPADVLSGKITLSGDMKTVTIHDVDLLDGIDWYYVLVAPGTITNNIECTHVAWSGISNPDEWLFKTEADVTDPDLTASAITSEACSPVYLEPATVAFELTFSEDVSVARGTGLAQIMEGTTVVASATITPAHIMGNVIKLNINDFDPPLMDGKDYMLVIAGNAIHDEATASLTLTQNPFGMVPVGNENWFEGVILPFKTGDFTAPVAVGFSPNGMMYLENNVTMVVTFSEPVQPGTGALRLYNAATDALVGEFMASADEDTNPLTVTLSKMLPDETSYYVKIEEGFVTDMIYMGSCDEVRGNVAVTSKTAWTFGIDDNTVPAITADLTVGKDNLMKAFDVVLQYNDVITAVDLTKAQLMLDGYAVGGAWKAMIKAGDPTQVIVSVLAVEDQKTYMLNLAPGFVLDNAHNANASLAAVTGPYMVGDRTNPILTAWNPKGILDTYIGVEVMVDFFDNTQLSVEKAITITTPGGNVISWVPVLDVNQSASFEPNLYDGLNTFGTYTVNIPMGAVKDVNGNEFAGFSWSFAIIDDDAPQDACLSIISPVDGENCVESDVTLEMEFCERMIAGDAGKLVKVYNILEVGGGLSENVLFTSFPVTAGMVDGTMVSIPLTGLADNTSYTIMMDAGALKDEAGNDFVGINNPIRWNFTTGDNTAPTVKLVPAGQSNIKNTIVVLAEFSEAVVNAENLIKVEGATGNPVIVMNAAKDVATITINAADMATVKVTVPTSITDVNCNFNPLAEEVTGTYAFGDYTIPTATVVPASATNAPNTWNVVVTFSEPVIINGGITVTGGTSVITNVGNVYTVAINAADMATVKLKLSDAITDASVNANKLAAAEYTYVVGDHIAPTATVVPASATNAPNTWNVVVTFSEPVIINGGITVTGGTSVITNVGNVYTVAITAADLATVKLNLSNAITDASVNANKLAAAEYTYVVGDNTAPMVAVYKPAATDTINSFDVVITFNEKVTGVDATSVTLTGRQPAFTLRTIIEGLAYEGTLSGIDGDTLVLGFSNAIMDLAGNKLVPVTFTYTIADNVAPTVMANPASGTNLVNENEVMITFSENVFKAATDITVSGAVEYEVEMLSYTQYKVSYVALDYANVDIKIPATITDWKGNAVVAKTFSYQIGDHVVPTATVEPAAATNAPNTWNVVVTFSEPVVINGGITVTGGTSVITNVGNVYTVAITAADMATVKLKLSNAITDASVNANKLAAAEYTYVVGDNTVPTATVTPASASNAPNTWDVVVTFSEPVIINGGITVTGGTSVITNVGNVYTVAITAVDMATVKLKLSNTITDTSVNANKLAAAEYTYVVGDHIAPTATVVPASATNAPNTWNVVVTFSEPVIINGGITVTGGTSVITNVGNVYTVAITAADMATVKLNLSNVITDASVNANKLAAAEYTYVVGDNTVPTATVTPASATNAPNTWNVVVTFSEPVIINGGITVTGGTSVITNVGNVYTVAITAADLATVKLNLSNAITDASVNANKLAAAEYTYVVGDNTVPTATVVPASATNAPNTWNVVVTFSEPVIINGGITVTGGTSVITNVGNVYTVAITAVDMATVKLKLSNAITDASVNANKLAAAEYTYMVGDNTAPTVAAEPNGGTNKPSTFDVILVFSEKVTGVESGVKVSGDGAKVVISTVVAGSAYKATITGKEKTTVVLSVLSTIKDLAGNALVAREFTYTIGDFTAPTVVANPASGNFVTNMFEVTLTFDELVTGVPANVTVSSGTVAVTGSGMVYVAKINAPSLSTVKLNLGNDIKDAANNNFAGATYSYNVTGIVPVTTIQNTPLAGSKLQVQGTVTAIAAGEGFFVQDANAAWSGIWIEYWNVGAANIKIGDGVLVTGEVAEVGDVTTVIASAVAKAGMGMTIIPMVATPNEAKDEKYESVLVKVEGARATAADAGSGEWKIYTETTNNVMVNDWLYKSTPVAGHFYDVTGVVNGRLDAFKMEPRMTSDVVDLTLTDINPVPVITFEVYPNPFSEYIQIDNNDKLVRAVIMNIAGQKVMDIEYPENRIRTANLVSGVYVISLFTEDGIAKTERIIKR